MDILIFSDSHGDTSAIRKMISRQLQQPYAIFFLGDGLHDTDILSPCDPPLYCVQGNCDWFSADGAPTEIVMAMGGHTIFATHGHLYHAKETDAALISHAIDVGADIVLFGHTHQPYLRVIPAGTEFGTLARGNFAIQKPIYLFNPGSLRAGSFGALTLRKNDVLFSHGTL